MLLRNKGMSKEPSIEHLVAQLPADAKSFSVNQFRSLDPDPPQNEDVWSDQMRKQWREILDKDEVVEELQTQFEQAARLSMELRIAQLAIKAQIALDMNFVE